MVKLIIDNSYSQITGLVPKQEKELRNTLSYVIGGSSAYFSGYGPKKRCLIDKKGFFPTGLLHRMPLIDAQVTDLRKKPILLWNELENNIKPYPAQLDALQAAMSIGRGIISMPTGTGKSLVIAMIAHTMGLKTLVVVPSLEIKKQLAANLKDLKNVAVYNIDSAALQTATGFDCLIIDEAHHVAAKTYQKLNKGPWKGIYHRFFMTATPFRNDTEETLLFESIAGTVIYSLSYKDAIKEKYIVPVEAYYIEAPKQTTSGHSYAQVYNELVVNNTARNFAIAELLTTLHSAGKSTLCLVKEVAHGNALAEITGLPFATGADEDSRKYIQRFNSGSTKVLIGTEGILSEGVDTKPCEYVIVAGLGKAKSNFMQKVGRAVRTYPGKESAKVIIIKDRSHKWTVSHFNAERKILLDEYGISVVKLD